MSPITTHVLDTALGQPASGMRVILELSVGRDAWQEIAAGVTNADGRLLNLLPDDATMQKGIYRLRFLTGEYHLLQGMPVFYAEVAVTVALDPTAGHFHLPLLLSPFGYSTYRGS